MWANIQFKKLLDLNPPKIIDNKIRNLILIIVAVIIPTLILWAPFFFRLPTLWGVTLSQNGMATIIANFDGPYYIVVAKTLYSLSEIDKFEFPLPKEYYAAHFPGFPLLIKAVSPLLGYPWAMMVITIITSIIALWFFYLLLNQLGLKKEALVITLVFAVFPARWLVVRSIGSPEPLFLVGILACFYFYLKKNYWLAGLAGALAMLTKSPGILLFIALFVSIFASQIQDFFLKPLAVIKKVSPIIFPLALIPLTLLGIFIFYGLQYQDFFAYFHSGDNIHLMFPPFQVFNAAQTWVGTFWLEEIIWIYLLGFLGIFQLIKMKRLEFAWFVGIFFLSTIFVSHRDIARYILPTVPFLLIAFSNIIVSRPFKWAIAFLLIPIYLFSINFIIHNVTPIADWTPLL